MPPRIHIPRELLKKLYYDNGLTQAQIADIIGCSERTIQERMIEFGFQVRNPNSPQFNIPKDTLRRLYYDEGLTTREIALQFGCSKGVIQRRMAEYGMKPRPAGKQPKYKVPEKVYRTWTPNIAYVVGLIATDGHLPKHRPYEVSFASSDRQLIDTYQKCLEMSIHVVKYKPKNGKMSYKVAFTDERFRSFLGRIGLTASKGKSMGPLKIPAGVFADFLRGTLDGDGSIIITRDRRPRKHKKKIYSYKYLMTQLSSYNLPFLEWVKNTSFRLLKAKGTISKGHGTWTLYFHHRASQQLLSRLYYAPTVPCLQRKRAIWEAWQQGQV